VKAQVVASRYVRREDVNGRTRRVSYRRGDEIEVTRDEFDANRVALRSWEERDTPLPAPNAAAASPGLTTPAGEPIDEATVEGGFGGAADVEGRRAPRTHAEADERAAELGIAFASDAKLEEKKRAIADVEAAGGSVEPVATEDYSRLDDAELRRRGEAFGLAASELEELDRDALVLRVAEAANARSANPTEQIRELERAQTEE
jgi:hypothetical protein